MQYSLLQCNVVIRESFLFRYYIFRILLCPSIAWTIGRGKCWRISHQKLLWVNLWQNSVCLFFICHDIIRMWMVECVQWFTKFTKAFLHQKSCYILFVLWCAWAKCLNTIVLKVLSIVYVLRSIVHSLCFMKCCP